ncbi:MAG: hypothetical protein IT347_06140 [Candidatus Eisenbacteria bacterium]|nr:hypothetical protein [Candidatus Eisenbacteria bacterium]
MTRLRAMLVAALGLLLAAPALAYMFEAPLEEIVASSDLVVKGRVTGLQSRFLDSSTRFIVTDVTLSVDEVWAGTMGAGRTVTFTINGGEVGEIGMRQEHQPVFSQGEEALVFLRAGTDARLAVNYAEQGKFTVRGEQAVGFKQMPIALKSLRGDVARLKPARPR